MCSLVSDAVFNLHVLSHCSQMRCIGVERRKMKNLEDWSGPDEVLRETDTSGWIGDVH